jgi:hypothetical protein
MIVLFLLSLSEIDPDVIEEMAADIRIWRVYYLVKERKRHGFTRCSDQGSLYRLVPDLWKCFQELRHNRNRANLACRKKR